MGSRVSPRSLCHPFLLQLLVGLLVARGCPLLDAGQLPPTPPGKCLLANPLSLHVDRGTGDDLLSVPGLSPGLLLVVSREEKRTLVPVGDHPAVGQLPGARLRLENHSGQRWRP